MLLLWFPWNLKKIENHGFYNTGEITNHGVIIAETTKGRCLKFNGSQYLGMDLPIGSMNCPLTVAWWCHWNTTGAYKAIISSRTLTGAGLSIWGSSDNHIRFDNGDNTNDTTQQHQFINHTFAKTDGLWYHYVVIQDDTTRKLYVNGALVQTIAQNNITGNTATTMLIGASAASDSINPNANFMNGYIGDLRIYNEALSADRIAKLAAGALSAPPPAKSQTTRVMDAVTQ